MRFQIRVEGNFSVTVEPEDDTPAAPAVHPLSRTSDVQDDLRQAVRRFSWVAGHKIAVAFLQQKDDMGRYIYGSSVLSVSDEKAKAFLSDLTRLLEIVQERHEDGTLRYGEFSDMTEQTIQELFLRSRVDVLDLYAGSVPT